MATHLLCRVALQKQCDIWDDASVEFVGYHNFSMLLDVSAQAIL
jgi:hypothetical protein